MNEIWKSIQGYEGKYEISNLGNVRSVDRFIINSKGIKHFRKSQLIKPVISHRGYVRVGLRNLGKKMFSVHRLVGIAFLLNPENKPMINHIDGNKQNNFVGNLEWVTQSENEKHAHEMGLKPKPQAHKGKFGKNNKSSKPIIQYDKYGNIVAEYFSITEAANKNKFDNSHIGKACKGKLKTAYNYIWKFKNKN